MEKPGAGYSPWTAKNQTQLHFHFHFQELAPVAKPSSRPYLIRHIVSSEETGCGLSFWSQLRAYPLPTTDQPGHYEKSHHVSSHIRPWSSDRLLPLSERFKVKMQELAWAQSYSCYWNSTLPKWLQNEGCFSDPHSKLKGTSCYES